MLLIFDIIVQLVTVNGVYLQTHTITKFLVL